MAEVHWVGVRRVDGRREGAAPLHHPHPTLGPILALQMWMSALNSLLCDRRCRNSPGSCCSCPRASSFSRERDLRRYRVLGAHRNVHTHKYLCTLHTMSAFMLPDACIPALTHTDMLKAIHAVLIVSVASWVHTHSTHSHLFSLTQRRLIGKCLMWGKIEALKRRGSTG